MAEQEGPGRPKRYDLKDLFQQALNLKLDESIVIPCRDFRETERTRNAFYRELNAMRRISPDLAEEIRISRIMKNKYFAVSLSRVQREALSAFLITEDGRIEQIERKVKEEDLERIERLMREDGYSEEDIENYMKNQEESMPEIGEEDGSI